MTNKKKRKKERVRVPPKTHTPNNECVYKFFVNKIDWLARKHRRNSEEMRAGASEYATITQDEVSRC